MQWLAVIHRQLGHLRLTHRRHTQLPDRLVELFGQQAVNHILPNLLAKPLLTTDSGTLPGAEARDLGVLAIIPNHGLEGLRNIFSGDIQHQFAGAFRIENRPMLMIGSVLVLVVMLVVRASFAFGSSAVSGCGSFSRVSVELNRFAFRARQTPNQLPQRADA